MPLNFLRRKKPEPASPVRLRPRPRAGPEQPGRTAVRRPDRGVAAPRPDAHRGPPSDALNKREAIEIHDVQWAPIDGSAPLSSGAGLQSVDPYDLILVLAGEGSLPELTDDERAAHRVHKVAYDVALEAPPFRVIGHRLHAPGLRAGPAPRPSDRDVRGGRRRRGDARRPAGRRRRRRHDPRQPAYLRGVEQIDKRTGRQGRRRRPGATPRRRPPLAPERCSDPGWVLRTAEQAEAGLDSAGATPRDGAGAVPTRSSARALKSSVIRSLRIHLDDRAALVRGPDEEQPARSDERQRRHPDGSLHVGHRHAAVGAVDDQREPIREPELSRRRRAAGRRPAGRARRA